MKQLLPLFCFACLLVQCTSFHAAQQTADDVYYSPSFGKPIILSNTPNEDKYANYFQQQSYYPRYHYTTSILTSQFSPYYQYCSCNYQSHWPSYYGYNPASINNVYYYNGYSPYYNPCYYPVVHTYSHQPVLHGNSTPHLSTYINHGYNNTNTTNTIKKIPFTNSESNNTYSNNSNSTSNPTRTFTTDKPQTQSRSTFNSSSGFKTTGTNTSTPRKPR